MMYVENTPLRGFNPANDEATFVISTRAHDFRKSSKPSYVGIHWIALAEYLQMNTHMPGFQSHSLVFCIILYCPT